MAVDAAVSFVESRKFAADSAMDRLRNGLCDLHDRCLDELIETLFDCAEHSCNEHEQARYFSLLRRVRRSYDEARLDFRVHLMSEPEPDDRCEDALTLIARSIETGMSVELDRLRSVSNTRDQRLVTPMGLAQVLRRHWRSWLTDAKAISERVLIRSVFDRIDTLYRHCAAMVPPDDEVALEPAVEEDGGNSGSIEERVTVRNHRAMPRRIGGARSAVDQIVCDHLDRQELPALISGLLGESWRNALLVIYLKEGPSSDEWKRAVELIPELIWTVQAKQTAADVARLQSTLPLLSATLRTGLERVGYSLDDIEGVFANLMDHYRESVGERYRDLLHMPSARASSLRFTAVKRVFTPLATAASDKLEKQPRGFIADRVRALKMGVWVEFKTPSGPPVRAKLSWRSPISKKMLFVDDNGIKVADMEEQELIEEVRSGEAMIVENGIAE